MEIMLIISIIFLAILVLQFLRAFRSFLHPVNEDVCITRIEGRADYGNYIIRGCQTEIEIAAVRPEKVFCPFCGKRIKYVESEGE